MDLVVHPLVLDLGLFHQVPGLVDLNLALELVV